ncbi:hypothetical protein KY285_010653 [Solanum tuberosum]|nr:hypothetical protein KY285_010653 [Solanum tuberosum]
MGIPHHLILWVRQRRWLARLVKYVHNLARLGVYLMNISGDDGIVQNGSESSLVSEVKEKQDSDPILLQLKGAVHQQRVEVFFQGGDGVLRYQSRLSVPKAPLKCNVICGKSFGGMT